MAQDEHLTAMATPPPELSSPSNDTLPLPIFTTSRLIIRPMHPQDAPSMVLHANSPLVARYMSLRFPHPYTHSDATTWIELNRTAPIDNWGIYQSCAPEVQIGGTGIKPGSDVNAHTAEIGFWIGEAYWGKGYTTEMLEGFTAWLFSPEQQERGLRRLWGNVFEGNVASMRCFEKCGYEKEGVLKGHCEKGGVVLDVHIFGLVKGDWERKKALK